MKKRYSDTFRESTYGKALIDEPYWKRYKPAKLSTSAWEQLIGKDASVFGHSTVMYDLAQDLINQDTLNSFKLNKEDKDILLVAAQMCIWGSSIHPKTGVGGDISYGEKTITEVERERQLFLDIFDELVGSDQIKLKFTISTILYDKHNKLGEIFRAIRLISYLHTALKAYNTSKKPSLDKDTKDRLEWLTANVFAHQITPLINYSASYEPVKHFLEENSKAIQEAFTSINPKVLSNFKEPHSRVEQFEDSRTMWQHRGVNGRALTSATEAHDRGIFSRQANFDSRFCVSYKDLLQKVEASRTLGLKIVLTSGSFDLIHIGHAEYLAKAKEYGDILVVGVDSDEKIRKRKGPGRPVVEEEERVRMVAHFRSADLITLKPANEKKWGLIKLIHPDILIATAETYSAEEINMLEGNHCGRVVVLPPQAKTSTSDRIRQLRIDGSKEAENLHNSITAFLSTNGVSQEILDGVNALKTQGKK